MASSCAPTAPIDRGDDRVDPRRGEVGQELLLEDDRHRSGFLGRQRKEWVPQALTQNRDRAQAHPAALVTRARAPRARSQLGLADPHARRTSRGGGSAEAARGRRDAEAPAADHLGSLIEHLLPAAADGARRARGEHLDLGRRAHLDRQVRASRRGRGGTGASASAARPAVDYARAMRRRSTEGISGSSRVITCRR